MRKENDAKELGEDGGFAVIELNLIFFKTLAIKIISGKMSLSSAIIDNDIENVKNILEENDMERDDIEHKFGLACGYGRLEIAQLLQKIFNIDVGCLDNYAIAWACATGHLNIVKYLHSQGADIRATVIKSDYPLRRACYNGHLDIVMYLCENGANPQYGIFSACEGRHYEIHIIGRTKS